MPPNISLTPYLSPLMPFSPPNPPVRGPTPVPSRGRGVDTMHPLFPLGRRPTIP